MGRIIVVIINERFLLQQKISWSTLEALNQEQVKLGAIRGNMILTTRPSRPEVPTLNQILDQFASVDPRCRNRSCNWRLHPEGAKGRVEVFGFFDLGLWLCVCEVFNHVFNVSVCESYKRKNPLRRFILRHLMVSQECY